MHRLTSGITEKGLVRKGNEDSFSIEDSLGLYIVADGMGGHQAGEVASRMAVEIINRCYGKWVQEKRDETQLFGLPDPSLSLPGNYLKSSIRLANRIIFEAAMGNKQYNGMGTTVGALLVSDSLLITANVGDSRIYLVRNENIERLSKDHTIVSEQIEMGIMSEEEALKSPMKHILTRSLGSAETVEPDIFELEISNDDRLILCTDGVTDLIKDDEILAFAQKMDRPKEFCQTMIQEVLNRGAHDNATIVSIFLSDSEPLKDKVVDKIVRRIKR